MGCEHVGTTRHCGESEVIFLECLLCAGCFVNLIVSSAPRGSSPWHNEGEMGLRKMTDGSCYDSEQVSGRIVGGTEGVQFQAAGPAPRLPGCRDACPEAH